MRKIGMTDYLFVFRNYIIKDLIDRGYKYIARDKDGAIFAYSDKPTKDRWLWDSNNASNELFSENISLVSRMFTDVKWEDVEPFRIPCVNWKEVPVDTPVLYTSGNGKNYVRHFCKYDEEDDRVVLYTDGRTSFTEQGTMATYPERVTIYEQGEKMMLNWSVPVFNEECDEGECPYNAVLD